MAEARNTRPDQGWRLAAPPRRLPPAANDNALPRALLVKRAVALLMVAALAAGVVAMKLG